MRDFVLFYLNGKPVTVRGEKTRMMLADFLRYEKHLTGTKIVCAEGDCGACSVLRCSPLQMQPGFVAINSCITTVAQMDGSSLVTIEGLADDQASDSDKNILQDSEHGMSSLHPIQKAMVDCHGSQCGFCTPGFVMATAGLVEKKIQQQNFCQNESSKVKDSLNLKLSEKETKNYLTGNLCRCTGYQPIIDAVTSVDLSLCQSLETRYWSKEISSMLEKHIQSSLWVQQLSGTSRWIYFAPTTLQEAKDYLHQQNDVKIVAAGTDFGVLVNKEKMEPTHWLSLNLIKELYQLKIEQKKDNQIDQNKPQQIWVGARVTLAEMRRQIETFIPEFAKFLDVFASPQIKNAATLVGNIANASPIADTPAFLLIANAVVLASGKEGDREIPLDKFYLGYRQTAIKPNEMIVAIRFDIPQKNEIVKLRKSSQRKDLDISCVNIGFRLLMNENKIADLKISMGGVAATPLRLLKTEQSLRGKSWDEKLLPELVSLVQSEINPISDLRGSSSFRRLLIENLLTQFHQEVLNGACP